MRVGLVEEACTLNIKVLGPGCYACYRVREVTMAAFEALADEYSNLQITIQHVENPQEVQRYAVLYMPGLVVNEMLVCAGRIPTVEEVGGWLREAHQACLVGQ